MIIAFTAGPAAVAVALAVFIGHLLTPKGRHQLAPSRSHRAEHAERQAEDWTARIRPHLPRAGSLHVNTDLLADPWDLVTQLPDPQDADPLDTGEFAALMGHGRWTGAQEADRLEAKFYPAPEVTP